VSLAPAAALTEWTLSLPPPQRGGQALLLAAGVLVLLELAWLLIRLLRFQRRLGRWRASLRGDSAALVAEVRRGRGLRLALEAGLAGLNRRTRLPRFAFGQWLWYRRRRSREPASPAGAASAPVP
jgi:hypothetical protein